MPQRDKPFRPAHQGINAGDLVDYVIDQHNARIRGLHQDYRFGKKGLGLHSFATTKDIQKATPGVPLSLFQQPTHAFKHLDFEGTIPPGYGAGEVKKLEKGKLLFTEVGPNELHYTVASKRPEERYALIKGQDKQWLMAKGKPAEKLDVEKPKFKNISPDQIKDFVKNLPETATAEPKIDGSLIYMLLKNKPELFSHRTSKRDNGGIRHTERFFGGRPEFKFPDKYRGSILMGELYGQQDGKTIAPQKLNAFLNSTIENSLNRQKQEGVQLKTTLFDIAKSKLSPDQKREALKEILKYLPTDKFELSQQVTGKKDIQSLIKQIATNKHPKTNEGVIVHSDGKSYKLKNKEEDDAIIKGYKSGEGKYKGQGIGSILYALKDNPDKIVGRVGSGLSDELRKVLMENPDEYIGRVLRVSHMGKFPNTKALKQPSILAMHESY